MLPSPGCYYFTDLLLLRPLQHHPILLSIPSIPSITSIIVYHCLSSPIISYYLLPSPIIAYPHLSPSIKFFAYIIMCTAVLSSCFVNISENFYKN